MIRRLALAIILAASLVGVGIYTYLAQRAPAQSREPLKIGSLMPLTGDAAAWGTKGRKGLQLAIDQSNSTGACGRSVSVIFEDSAAQPSTGLSAFQKLISVDQVPIVIGDLVSSVTLAIAPTAERNKVVVLSPTASAPAITTAGEYIYRIWPSDLEEARAIAAYAIRQGYKRAAVLFINNEYGLGLEKAFRDSFATQGREVVLSESYLETNQDFRSALSKVKGLNPDVLYVSGYYGDSAILVRQARDLGLTIPILGNSSVEDKKFLDVAGNAAEGLVYPLATGYDVTSSNPLIRRFIESFQRQFNEQPGWVEAQAYDAMGVVCQATKGITDGPTGEKLKGALDRLGAFQGVTGEIKFDQNGDVVGKPIRLRVIRNGKFANLDQ